MTLMCSYTREYIANISAHRV